MPDKKHLIIAGVLGVIAGFYLANATSGTGIYSTFIGQTAANIYTSGNNAGGA